MQMLMQWPSSFRGEHRISSDGSSCGDTIYTMTTRIVGCCCCSVDVFDNKFPMPIRLMPAQQSATSPLSACDHVTIIIIIISILTFTHQCDLEIQFALIGSMARLRWQNKLLPATNERTNKALAIARYSFRKTRLQFT